MNAPDPDAVKTELERILSSNVFKKSVVLSNFLRFVVNETIEDNAECIKEYSIAVSALGRPADFNPQVDSTIRIHAGRLRRSLFEYYSEEGVGDSVIISLNRGSYVPEFSMRSKVKERLYDIAPAVSENKLTFNRLAVLPFKNLSGLPENDFIVDGFGEQLSADLAQFREIAVIAYYSTSKFKEDRPDIRRVGKELNVSHLLTGSIYRDKKRLRISMQLSNTLTGAQLWAETFEQVVNSSYLYDLFKEIISKVVPKLSGYYGIISRSSSFTTRLNPGTHADTIDAVFWVYHYQIRYTEETFQIARNRIEKALQQNPDYALGWGVLAQMYIDGEALCYKTVDNPIGEANKCIERALQLDNDCQHAYMSLSWMYAFLREKNNVIKNINKCLSINTKSPFFLGAASCLMGLQGEYETSMEYFNQLNVLNPYYPWWVNLGPIYMYYYNDDYESALEFANRINIPGVFWNHIYKISALGQLGRLGEANIAAEKFKLQFPGKAEHACRILHSVLYHESVYVKIKEGLSKSGMLD